MKKPMNYFLIICISFLIAASHTWAGALTVTNDFVNGQTADANQMNQNFSDVEAQVNDNDSRIETNEIDIETNEIDIENNSDDISNSIDAIGEIESLILAYGKVISNDGTVGANSNNISSCTWDATSSRYYISITGESIFWTDYVTLITPVDGPMTFETGSLEGNLLVTFYDSTGARVQSRFSFLILKP